MNRPQDVTDRSLYEYNPACDCEVCADYGRIRPDHPGRGHSLAYGSPHIPPTRSPFQP